MDKMDTFIINYCTTYIHLKMNNKYSYRIKNEDTWELCKDVH